MDYMKRTDRMDDRRKKRGMDGGTASSRLRGVSTAGRLRSVPVLFALIVSVACGGVSAGVDFIVPGVSLKSVVFEEGASVSYMIISEAYDVMDTTMATLKVLSAGSGGYELEIVSSSWPVVTGETVTVRLGLGAGIESASTPDEVGALIRKVLVREGTGEFREPTGEELEEFGIERLFLREREGMTEERLPGRAVRTPAGEFQCEVTSFHRSVTSRVDLGGVGADRFEEEKSTVMTSGDVPFWGLVR
ncbi:MAG TPA: hypothetical protein VLA34_01980, partial [Candidatus Krumholzibacterium sp.]|nr:hypothetical protein [Candidatus Krumholzibacterium sp.]